MNYCIELGRRVKPPGVDKGEYHPWRAWAVFVGAAYPRASCLVGLVIMSFHDERIYGNQSLARWANIHKEGQPSTATI